ncbi:nucleoside hydrolase [Sporosarcina thermotolerans]|uniref:nucleoside hydrolase n=1 Tax=Sporosarcina thermotolerans TaxID=633404 RepID=UPI003D2F665E
MKPVIVDVDTGIDDALAITYALKSPELDVIGLTTCFGNNSLENTTRSTLVILERLRKTVPVYMGADKPLKRGITKFPLNVHGEDGLGNNFSENPVREAEAESAVDFIISQVKASTRNYTNSSRAVNESCPGYYKSTGDNPSFQRSDHYGWCSVAPGNVTPYSEANILADPEAADYVFSSGLPVTIVGLDVTMKTILPAATTDEWRAIGTDESRFYADMTDFYIQAYETFEPGFGGCALHDPLAVGVAIDPDFVKREEWNVKVVLDGEETGRTVASAEGEPKVQVCTEVKAEQFLDHFLGRIL